jgi:hypothetical protein
LADGKGAGHIPYRNSKLTRILSNELGGNSMTAIIATCSPAMSNFHQSLSSLKFATRAKTIKNKPKLNEMTDHDNPANELKGLNVKYERLIGEKDEIIRDLKDRITALEISSSKKSVKDSIGENFLRDATNGNANEWLDYYKGFKKNVSEIQE